MADLRTMNNQKQNKTDSMANAVMMNPIIRKMDKKTKEEAASNNWRPPKSLCKSE